LTLFLLSASNSIVTSAGKLKSESNRVSRTHGEERGGVVTKSASAMSTDDTRGSGEFPDVVVADAFTVDTGLDAITLTLNLKESEIDFSGDAGNIETPDI
jgi:hypothetical protein